MWFYICFISEACRTNKTISTIWVKQILNHTTIDVPFNSYGLFYINLLRRFLQLHLIFFFTYSIIDVLKCGYLHVDFGRYNTVRFSEMNIAGVL